MKSDKRWPAEAGVGLDAAVQQIEAIKQKLREEIPLPRSEQAVVDGVVRSLNSVIKKLGAVRNRVCGEPSEDGPTLPFEKPDEPDKPMPAPLPDGAV